ncbi:HAD hydrolase-like protein [Methanococcoides sp. SA1]|nr:HAD hydrolase-like protein [Methanococcoides sp. SA1]
MMAKRKELFLDYGELIFYHRFNSRTLSRAHNLVLKRLKSKGYLLEKEDLEDAHNKIIRKYLDARQSDDSEWSMNKIMRKVVDTLGVDRRIVPVLVDTYKLHDHDYWPMETTARMLPTLSKKYNLHIISNIPHDSLYVELEKYGMRNFFKTITLSADVGVRKPHSKIYNVAMGKVGVTPKESLFVSHDEVEVDGSREAGMRGFLAKSLEEVAEVIQ